MPSEIYLVKAGMTMEEGTVEEWYVADGKRAEPGEMLYRLETEKVNLDVDAETAGTVKHLVGAGTTCKPGDVVGYIYADDETIPDVLPTPKPRPDIGAPSEPEPDAKPIKPAAARPRRGGGRIAASPVARKLAAELGLDLANVTGTGPRGRITKEDVQAAADAAATAPGKAQAGSSTPLTGMRRTIAERMHGSLRDTAQLTMDMEVAMDDAVKLRRDLVAEWESEGIRVTYTDLVLAASTKALVKHPAMNSALQDDALVHFGAVHLGVAVALDEGLIVPVIKDAQAKSLKEIAAVSAELAGRARDGKLTLDEVEGRHLHGHLARHVRRRYLHADPEPAPSRHPRRWTHLRRPSMGGRYRRQGRHDATVADLGSPRPRRRPGGGIPGSSPRLPRVALPIAGLATGCRDEGAIGTRVGVYRRTG